jgi:hypothetical protein
MRLRLGQPWSLRLGQLAYLPQIIRGHEETRRAFAEEPVIERLAGNREPLEGVGAEMSERVVEIPWVIRRLPASPGARILDIGTAFSPVVYKRLLIRQPQSIDVADLAPAFVPGLTSHVADVRDLPFPDDTFDVAICLSTLEHIGMDNAQYDVQSGGEGDVQALRELGRVARRVLVTVPAGVETDMGWQRQYSPDAFRRVVEAAGLSVLELDLFAHDAVRGWAPADEDAVAQRTYGQGAIAAAANICAELTRQ